MKAKLSEHLVCPQCKSPLACAIYREDVSLAWPEIMEGCLTCQGCGRAYPIHNGVPRLMIDDLPGAVKRTVEGFGWEWQKFNDEIQDTYMTDKANFLDFIYPVTETFFAGKWVLDAGCGMGRFLKLGAEFGSQEIIGVDLSQAVEVAYQNTRTVPNAHVVQADILNLPLVKQFDYIFCIGVLQFLPDPQLGFARLAERVAEGGSLSAWVYSQENNRWLVWGLTPLRKYLTSRLPRPMLYLLCQVLGLPLYLGLQFIYKPANEGRLGFITGRLLPYNDYLYYTSRLTYASLVSIIFDHLVPQLVTYLPREQFEAWFRAENLSPAVITTRNKMSWRGFGRSISN